MFKNSFRFFISIAVASSLLLYTFSYFDTTKILNTIKTADLKVLSLSFLLLIFAYILRGVRWTIWENNLSVNDSFRILLIGFMGNNILPARLGELLRAHCTAEKSSKGYGRTAALASIGIERILDGLVISVYCLIGLYLVPIERLYALSLLTVSLLFFLLTTTLLLSIYFHLKIRSAVDYINQIFPGHITKFGKDKINFFLDGLLLIKGFKKFSLSLLLSFFIWGIELFSYFFVAQSITKTFSMEMSLLFLAAVNFASLFPMTIGGIGAIEGATTLILFNAGVHQYAAFSMVIIQHTMQFLFTTFLGGIYYFVGGYYKIPFIKRPPSYTDNSFEEKAAGATDNELLLEVERNIQNLPSGVQAELSTEKKTQLSIVIPAYNEQNRLPGTLLSTLVWCDRNLPSYEIIVVDDGSKDETANLVNLFSKLTKNVRYILCPHQGKGNAVRIGMLNAWGTYVLFMDADGATPLKEIKNFLCKMEQGFDVVIGSRVVQNPSETKVITSFHRKFIGRSFSAVVNLFAIPGFADTQCGFKIFRSKVAKKIFSQQKLSGFAFDVEILYIARMHNFNVLELPITWVNQEGSKVNIFIDSFKMLVDVLKIRWIHRNAQI